MQKITYLVIDNGTEERISAIEDNYIPAEKMKETLIDILKYPNNIVVTLYNIEEV